VYGCVRVYMYRLSDALRAAEQMRAAILGAPTGAPRGESTSGEAGAAGEHSRREKKNDMDALRAALSELVANTPQACQEAFRLRGHLHQSFCPGGSHVSAYVSMRQHTSAYVSIRQHTSAYVSIRQHASVILTHISEPPCGINVVSSMSEEPEKLRVSMQV